MQICVQREEHANLSCDRNEVCKYMQEEEYEEKRSILHEKLVHITLYVTIAGPWKRLFFSGVQITVA